MCTVPAEVSGPGSSKPVKSTVGEVNVGPLRIALSSQREQVGARVGLVAEIGQEYVEASPVGDLAGEHTSSQPGESSADLMRSAIRPAGGAPVRNPPAAYL